MKDSSNLRVRKHMHIPDIYAVEDREPDGGVVAYIEKRGTGRWHVEVRIPKLYGQIGNFKTRRDAVEAIALLMRFGAS